jgi:hypothetical protein
MSRQTDDLHLLHDHYVAAVNRAVAADDLPRADRLAAEYDEEAALLGIEHDGHRDGHRDAFASGVDQPAPSRLQTLLRTLTRQSAA